MRQVTTTKHMGLYNQANSFELPQGAFEQLDNASCIYDNLVQKRRGAFESYRLPSGQLSNLFFSYQNINYILTQNSLYRFDDILNISQVICLSGTNLVTVRSPLHQILNGDYVSSVAVTNADAFVAAFPTRANAFTGIKQVTTDYAVTGTRITNVVTVSLLAHGLQVGDGVQFTASSLSEITLGQTYVVTSVTTNTFTFVSIGTNQAIPQAITLYTQDKFTFNAFEQATATVTSAAGAATYQRYIKQSLFPGVSLSTSALPYSRALAENLNRYFLTDNGLYKLDAAIANVQKAGLPPTTSTTVEVGAVALAWLPNNTRVAYRAIYTRTDATNNLFFSAPGESIEAANITGGTAVTTVRVWLNSGLRVGDTVRIYRTSQVPVANTPVADYRLVIEQAIVQVDLTRGYVIIGDNKFDNEIASNPLLYTNPNQETEAQAAYPPPYALDVATYKNYACYANYKRPFTGQINFVSAAGIVQNDALTIGNTTYNFRLRPGVGNTITTSPATTAGYVEITQANHGFGVNDYIFVEDNGGITNLPNNGEYQITAVPTANTFRFGLSAIGSGNVRYFGTKDNLGVRLVSVDNVTAGVAAQIEFTARALVRAVNQTLTSNVFAQYITGIGGTPGLMAFTQKELTSGTFGITSLALNTKFFPPLPFNATQDYEPAGINFAKLNEPESVPLLQSLVIGAQNAPILRVHAIRDSLIVIKTDGVWRVNGSQVTNFSTSILDSTTICRAVNSSVVLNNSVYLLSNQGVVEISDSAIKIVSRPIEPLFTNILSKDLTNTTFGFAYESERLYILTTLRPNQSTPDINYVYNYVTQSWSTWSGTTTVHAAGNLKIGDFFTWAGYADRTRVYQERKEQNLTDYVDNRYAVQVIRSLLAPAFTQVGSSLITVDTPFNHGLTTGDLITVSNEALLDPVFTGPADINGLRVATVITPNRFTFAAATNATAYVIGNLSFNRGLNQFALSTQTTVGSVFVVFTTPVAHGLVNGNTVTVESTTVTSLTSAQLIGPRTVSVLSPTTFSVQADAGASATQTASAVLSDFRINKKNLTVYSWQLTPQVGDGIIYAQTGTSTLLKLVSVNIYRSIGSQVGVFQVQSLTNYERVDTTYVELSQGITSRLKFVPQTAGDTGTLKYFVEYQASFRNAVSCTKLTVNFGNDSKISTVGTNWDFRANSSKSVPNFYGWGAALWGEVPWGSDAGTLKQYSTGPASILRTLLPKEVFVGTFLQPSFIHRVSGESIDLQSTSIFIRPVTQRTSR